MTVNVSENNTETPNVQEKVDTNLSQSNVDTNTTQQNRENKEQESQEDPNWRAFREARKKDRADREAAERRAQEKDAEVAALKAAMEAAFSKGLPVAQSQSYSQTSDYQSEESEDERIEKKVQAAIAKREAESERVRIEREHQEYPTKLVQSYPDFNHMISQDNLDYLDYHYPEVSRPLQRLKDGFDKWSDIYQAIKKFVPNNNNSKKDAARADANFSKPKSISSPSINQSSESGSNSRITEEKRAANWQRMQNIMKGLS